MQCDQSLLHLLAAMRRGTRHPAPITSAPHAIALARSLIDDDPAASLTLDDLARASGLSRFQVLRGFVKATELTPHAYLVQRRIALARRLIGGGSTLADAAAASGFADQSHMTRIFVRKYGLSPGAYAAAMA
jgi:AraC-like DNA-binding protein